MDTEEVKVGSHGVRKVRNFVSASRTLRYMWSTNAALVGSRGFGECMDSIQDLFGLFLCVIYSWIGSNQFSE